MSPLPSRRLSARESLPLLLCVVHSCAAFAPPAPMPKSRGGGMGLRRVLPLQGMSVSDLDVEMLGMAGHTGGGEDSGGPPFPR